MIPLLDKLRELAKTLSNSNNKADTIQPLRRDEYENKYQMILRDWLLYHQQKIVFEQVSWMGIKN